MLLFLSVLPIACVLLCLLVLKLSAAKSGALGFCTATFIYCSYFRCGAWGLTVTLAKGIGLASFVVFIIWGAIFLYNLVKESGALVVINTNIQIIVQEKFVQFLLLSWIFSSFLQGIAGFGVPVAVVTPILAGLGFDPALSAAAVLIGHSWSISFGSMGSSIFAMNLVTKADINEVIMYMAFYGTIAMALTGLMVCFTYDGVKGLRRGILYVGLSTFAMGGVLYLTAWLKMLSLMGLTAGFVGIVTLFFIYRIRFHHIKIEKLHRTKLSFADALLPYLLIVALSLFFSVLNPTASISFDFPGYVTLAGKEVLSEEGYVTFNLLKYPCTIILMASLISMGVYRKRGVLDRDTIRRIIKGTAKKCGPASLTIVFLLCMAVMLMDSGMIEIIADGLVEGTHDLYPLISPYIGMLGAFVTGSNTNSNIIFGKLQEMSANSLGLSAVVMCAAQSIGASVGGAIGPTTVSMGAAAAQIQGEESKIYRKTIMPVLLIVLILGVVNLIVT